MYTNVELDMPHSFSYTYRLYAHTQILERFGNFVVPLSRLIIQLRCISKIVLHIWDQSFQMSNFGWDPRFPVIKSINCLIFYAQLMNLCYGKYVFLIRLYFVYLYASLRMHFLSK